MELGARNLPHLLREDTVANPIASHNPRVRKLSLRSDSESPRRFPKPPKESKPQILKEGSMNVTERNIINLGLL